jgi:hypothetical protein
MVSRFAISRTRKVQIDPAIPLPESLSVVGRDRVTALAAAGWLSGTSQIIATAERKAMRRRGFLPPAEFDVVVDGLLSQPKNQRARPGAGRRCPSADRAGRRFWIGHHAATGSSSVMGRSALCCSATTEKSPSAGRTLKRPEAATISGAFCSPGGLWRNDHPHRPKTRRSRPPARSHWIAQPIAAETFGAEATRAQARSSSPRIQGAR